MPKLNKYERQAVDDALCSLEIAKTDAAEILEEGCVMCIDVAMGDLSARLDMAKEHVASARSSLRSRINALVDLESVESVDDS